MYNKMLLHICCGPCSMFVIDDLRDFFKDVENFMLWGFMQIPIFILTTNF